MAVHNELGRTGEAAAVDYLLKNGHQILCTNWRHGRGEIDIISMEKNVVVFTEVKTRKSEYFGFPEESVSSGKKRLMAAAAAAYLEEKELAGEVRFDIISVVVKKDNIFIHHFPDAFFPVDELE